MLRLPVGLSGVFENGPLTGRATLQINDAYIAPYVFGQNYPDKDSFTECFKKYRGQFLRPVCAWGGGAHTPTPQVLSTY